MLGFMDRLSMKGSRVSSGCFRCLFVTVVFILLIVNRVGRNHFCCFQQLPPLFTEFTPPTTPLLTTNTTTLNSESHTSLWAA